VIGWWTVATTGKPARCSASRPVPRVWVVVDDVEVALPTAQDLRDAQAERQRLRERRRAHERELEHVDR
jgi:hypothetical protein